MKGLLSTGPTRLVFFKGQAYVHKKAAINDDDDVDDDENDATSRGEELLDPKRFSASLGEVLVQLVAG